MPDFLWLAAAAGTLTCLMAGPLGSFVIWRRMAYLGDSLAHSALLGIVIALMAQLPLLPVLVATTLLIAVSLVLIHQKSGLERDAILGILSHSALAIGLLLWRFTPSSQVSLEAFLFGDLLTTSLTDIFTMAIASIIVIAVIVFYWRDFLSMTLSPELAEVEGVPVLRREYLLMALMALVVAMAIKVVGVLLITALLIIPASTARFFTSSPASMSMLASILGILATVGGLAMSWFIDTPPGPGIVVIAFGFFLVGLVFFNKRVITKASQ